MSERQYQRIALALEVEYRNAGAFLVAYSTNLSKGGMFVETADPLPIGSEIALRFAIPGAAPIDVLGIVTWIQAHSPERPAGMGIRFETLEARFGDAIDAIVSGFAGLRILVMDADDNNRAQLVRSVRTVIGSAELIEAPGIAEAEAALTKDLNLVVIDLAAAATEGNPGASNPGAASAAAETLLCVRLAKSARPPVPVLAMGADDRRRELAREIGADAVLASPPQFSDLQTTILRLLGRPSLTALR